MSTESVFCYHAFIHTFYDGLRGIEATQMIHKWTSSSVDMIVTEENRRIWSEIYTNVTSSTTNPIFTAVGAKPGISGKNPAIFTSSSAMTVYYFIVPVSFKAPWKNVASYILFWSSCLISMEEVKVCRWIITPTNLINHATVDLACHFKVTVQVWRKKTTFHGSLQLTCGFHIKVWRVICETSHGLLKTLQKKPPKCASHVSRDAASKFKIWNFRVLDNSWRMYSFHIS